MNIKIVEDKITLEELRTIGKEFYDDMVKGAMDVKKGIVAFGGEYHIDAANVLTENGADGADVWGFNVVFKPKGYGLEYTALINIKPSLGNLDMYIENTLVRKKIEEVVASKITV